MNKRAEIDKLLVGREDLKGGLLYSRSVSFVYEVLNLPYWKDSRFKKLLTPNIWRSSIYDIVNILSMKEWDEPKFTELLTSGIWHKLSSEIKEILSLPYWDDSKYSHLLTSGIWCKSACEIKEILSLPYWNEYSELLTSSIWNSNIKSINNVFQNEIIMSNPNLLKPSIFSITLKNVEPVYELFKEYGIENYITINSFRRGVSKQRSLFTYMEENDIPFLVGDDELKLNPILNASNAFMKKKYDIDFNDLHKRGVSR